MNSFTHNHPHYELEFSAVQHTVATGIRFMPSNYIHDLMLPESMVSGWQTLVNLATDILSASCAMVIRVSGETVQIICHNNNHPHPEPRILLLQPAMSCLNRRVIENRQALIVDIPLDNKEKTRQELPRTGRHAPNAVRCYCGIPLYWPEGELFGVLCVWGPKAGMFNDTHLALLNSFKESLEYQLTTLVQNHKLQRLDDELRQRLEPANTALKNLHYSLIQEMDKRRAAEQKIQYQKYHDIGTGFLNRTAFEHTLKHAVASLNPEEESLAVALIDLANAASVQAQIGHRGWDQILTLYREKLGEFPGIELMTARLSARELCMVIKGPGICDQLNALCDRLVGLGRETFLSGRNKVHLQTYIGMTTIQNSRDAAELIQQAGAAVKYGKSSGAPLCFYSPSQMTAFSHLPQLENYLLHAVRNADITVYFQPKVNLQTHRWTGAEALLRWRHPVLGDISNERLIHMAKENGLIFDLGEFVLRQAINKASRWAKTAPDFKIAVNVSAIQLKNEHFSEQVMQLLGEYHLSGHSLELEVTESGLITDDEIAQKTLNDLHHQGITLSLDDFGVGYTSYNYLRKYPFDCIKIDKTFIKHLEQSKEDRTIVRSIISIAKKFGLKVICEGIENTSQEALVQRMGGDYGQGYLYGKAMSSEEFERRMP